MILFSVGLRNPLRQELKFMKTFVSYIIHYSDKEFLSSRLFKGENIKDLQEKYIKCFENKGGSLGTYNSVLVTYSLFAEF